MNDNVYDNLFYTIWDCIKLLTLQRSIEYKSTAKAHHRNYFTVALAGAGVFDYEEMESFPDTWNMDETGHSQQFSI